MPLLEIKDLALGYDSDIVASGIDLNINAGDYICILGENGAGKTTFTKTLLGLIKPCSGTITRSGIKQNDIGYMPQQSSFQKDFPASVGEIVLSGRQSRCGLRPFYNSKDKKEAEAAMEKMGIKDLKSRCYRELSGGQKQRVLLARAICAAQKILILDEPVSGLDPKASADLYSLIESLNKEGMAIIMITHDLNAALKFSSHILHIGSDVFYGKKEDYLRDQTGKEFVSKEVCS